MHEMCNCKQEYRKLKLELENCKSKYRQQQKQLQTGKGGGGDVSSNPLADDYRTQINALKQEKKLVIRNFEEKEKNFLDVIHKLETERKAREDTNKQAVDELQRTHVKQTANLQMELQKQRNRSMNLISEKDMEIEKLQKVMYDQDGLPGGFSSAGRTTAVLQAQQMNVLSEELEDFLTTPTVSLCLYSYWSVFYRLQKYNWHMDKTFVYRK